MEFKFLNLKGFYWFLKNFNRTRYSFSLIVFKSLTAFFLTGTNSFSQSFKLQQLKLSDIEDYFKPKPAGTDEMSLLQVSRSEFFNREQTQPQSLKGQLTVKPPANRCIVITKAKELPDLKICSEQGVAFEVRELDPEGRLNWKIKLTNPETMPLEIRWETPHRLAQWIAPGEKKPRWLPIATCEYLPETNSLRLNHFTTTTGHDPFWQIDFPLDHTLIPQPPDPPNLFTRRFTRKKGGLGVGKTKVNPNVLPPPFDFPEVEKTDPVDKHWSIPRRNTYTMAAKNFRMNRTDMRPVGECRYQLEGADFDEKSGWIECHDGYDYEVVMVNLSCANKVKITNFKNSH